MVIVVINKMEISFKPNVLLSIRSFRAKNLKPFNFDRLFFDWPIESRFGRVKNHLFYSEKMLKTSPFTFFFNLQFSPHKNHYFSFFSFLFPLDISIIYNLFFLNGNVAIIYWGSYLIILCIYCKCVLMIFCLTQSI